MEIEGEAEEEFDDAAVVFLLRDSVKCCQKEWGRDAQTEKEGKRERGRQREQDVFETICSNVCIVRMTKIPKQWCAGWTDLDTKVQGLRRQQGQNSSNEALHGTILATEERSKIFAIGRGGCDVVVKPGLLGRRHLHPRLARHLLLCHTPLEKVCDRHLSWAFSNADLHKNK